MISILVSLPLVLYDCHSFLCDYHSAPAPDLLLLHHYSLELVAEYFSFVAWVLVRYRCFLVDCWNLTGEDLCIRAAVVRRGLLDQYS
jgi:hypothetical protein